MRKYLFGLFVAAYLVAATGVPVYLHFCGGELEHVSVLVKEDSCCGSDEEESDNGCCSDQDAYFKCATDFTVHKYETGPPPVLACIFSPVRMTVPSLTEGIVHSDLHVPPLLQSRLVSASVLRI